MLPTVVIGRVKSPPNKKNLEPFSLLVLPLAGAPVCTAPRRLREHTALGFETPHGGHDTTRRAPSDKVVCGSHAVFIMPPLVTNATYLCENILCDTFFPLPPECSLIAHQPYVKAFATRESATRTRSLIVFSRLPKQVVTSTAWVSSD